MNLYKQPSHWRGAPAGRRSVPVRMHCCFHHRGFDSFFRLRSRSTCKRTLCPVLPLDAKRTSNSPPTQNLSATSRKSPARRRQQGFFTLPNLPGWNHLSLHPPPRASPHRIRRIQETMPGGSERRLRLGVEAHRLNVTTRAARGLRSAPRIQSTLRQFAHSHAPLN